MMPLFTRCAISIAPRSNSPKRCRGWLRRLLTRSWLRPFEEHLKQTKGHVERLEKAFKRLDASTRGEKCKAMEGLIEEGKSTLELDADDMVRDALLIGVAQKVEHYEIAGYGTARTFAQRLGEDNIASLLEETLEEESETDRKLTQIAESAVNPDAENQND